MHSRHITDRDGKSLARSGAVDEEPEIRCLPECLPTHIISLSATEEQISVFVNSMEPENVKAGHNDTKGFSRRWDEFQKCNTPDSDDFPLKYFDVEALHVSLLQDDDYSQIVDHFGREIPADCLPPKKQAEETEEHSAYMA
eukprot:365705_1